MRLWLMLRGDIRFQFKYGFYYLYIIFTAFYTGLLAVLPEAWREKAAILMIFSDPAAMGLYFMGAIILFEKSERVLDSIAVSPARTYEYTLSKLFSIGVISSVVGVAIGFLSNAVNISLSCIFGIFLCSCLFSATGLVIATKSTSLNGFMLATIPAELVINIPAIIWLFGWRPAWLQIHPGVSLMEILEGKRLLLLPIVILSCWTILAAILASRAVKGMLRRIGGIKL